MDIVAHILGDARKMRALERAFPALVVPVGDLKTEEYAYYDQGQLDRYREPILLLKACRQPFLYHWPPDQEQQAPVHPPTKGKLTLIDGLAHARKWPIAQSGFSLSGRRCHAQELRRRWPEGAQFRRH
jgi:hypothetical protein